MSHYHGALCYDLIALVGSHIAYYGNDTVLYRLQHVYAKVSTTLSRLASLSRPLVMTLNINPKRNWTRMLWTIPCDLDFDANIVIDWGDECIERLLTRQGRYPEHRYVKEGMYTARVYRIGGSAAGGLWHLGWNLRTSSSADGEFMIVRYPMFFREDYGLFPLAHLQSLGNVGTIDLSRCCTSSYGSPTFGRVDTRSVTNMSGMFANAAKFNSPVQHLNTSKVTDMSGMFYGASQFNQPLNAWNTSSVTTMKDMFRFATRFDQPLDAWNTSQLVTAYHMFWGAEAFQQDVRMWDLKNMVHKFDMLY